MENRKRLKVFEKITGTECDSPSRKVRIVEKVENWKFSKIVQMAYSFGDVQSVDLFENELIVGFFDIRPAKRFFESFDGKVLVQFEKCVEKDFVWVLNEDYFEVLPLLSTCGEIMDVKRVDESFCVYFFDVRAARAAFFVVNKEDEISSDSLELSFLSDSSPYLLTISPSTSTENSFDEGRFQKNTNFFKIYLERVCSGQDQRTSLMIRNIPNKYTQVMLLQLINKKFELDYDFFYLPIDFRVEII
jgi:hypothetical protein